MFLQNAQRALPVGQRHLSQERNVTPAFNIKPIANRLVHHSTKEQEIKKTAVSINNGLSEDNLPAIKRRVVRLIGQIDTNIEHDDDLEAFRNSFDNVHHNFLKSLGERYPQLSHKEKMLCAYIRMNLMSKEIAPLLNISIRGVEIARYRIRQKLALEQKDSLTEFLQSL